jgi:type II secretory pathway predicted ATPase ExeA
VLGTENSDKLTSVGYLVSRLERQGKNEEVEAVHRQVLAGREATQGTKNPRHINQCQPEALRTGMARVMISRLQKAL